MPKIPVSVGRGPAVCAAVAGVVALAVVALGGYAVAFRGDQGAGRRAAGAPVALDPTHEHGAHGEDLPPVHLTPAQQAEVDHQLARARAAARRLRTVAQALAAGYVPVGQEQDRNDVHLVRWDRMDQRIDAGAPEMLIAQTRDPAAPILAVVYYDVTSSRRPPEGFAGPNDHWHQHRSICRVGDALVGEGPDEDPAACRASGGSFGTTDGWMLHAWVVPGEANPFGVFAPDNPERPAG